MRQSPYHDALALSASLTRDQLAELVSEGVTIADAGRALSLSLGMAKKHWTRIRADLGVQAR